MYKNISISTKCVDTKLKFTFDKDCKSLSNISFYDTTSLQNDNYFKLWIKICGKWKEEIMNSLRL